MLQPKTDVACLLELIMWVIYSQYDDVFIQKHYFAQACVKMIRGEKFHVC